MHLKAQVIAINKLLSDIYRRDMRLSYLLIQLDFSCEDIKLINYKLLPDVVDIFLKVLEETVTDFQDGARQLKIIKDLYGLRCDRVGLRQVGTELNISHERVRQLKEKVIKKLASKNKKLWWESEYKQQIRQLIDDYNCSKQLETQEFYSTQKYNFQLSPLPTGEQCLAISKGNCQIIVTESDFQEFYSNLQDKLELLGWNNFKAYKIEDVRRQYPKAYEKWTKEEELLKKYLYEDLNTKEIAELLERQPGAIVSRINKLGLSR